VKVRLKTLLRNVSLWRTLVVNLRLFPLKTALKFPVLCGRRLDAAGLRRGAVKLTCEPYFGAVVLGISPNPRFPVQGMWTLFRISRGGSLECGPGFVVRAGASVIVTGRLECGEDVLINQRALVSCQKSMKIGSHTRIGWDAQVLDSDCHLVYHENGNRIFLPYKPVVIGRNVWIASRVNVGKGAVVPDYSIVGRGSFLNKDFGSVKTRGNVFVGSPAALRATGCYRLLDIPLEIRVSKEFKDSDREWMTPEELGVDVEKALNPPPHRGMA
jgi:acetyltransferase-like isoleucine patch superfamily enzyme